MTRILSSLFSKLASTRTPRTRLRSRPRVEELEARRLLTSDWFSYYMPSPNVADMARNAWYSHSAVNYNDMLQIYSSVEKDGTVDANEITSLRFLAQYGNSSLN